MENDMTTSDKTSLDPIEPEWATALRSHFTREYGEAPSGEAIWLRLRSTLPEAMASERISNPLAEPTRPRPSAAPQPATPIEEQPRRARHWAARHGALAAAIALVAFGAATFYAFAPHRSGSPMTTAVTTATPAPAQHLQPLTSAALLADVQLSDVQMLSTTDGWAVGTRELGNGRTQALILHYANGRWNADPFTLHDVFLSCLDMVSPDDGWAGGSVASSSAGFLLHDSGGRWSEVATPDGLPVIQIRMLTSDEGWAIESRPGATNPPEFYMLHYSHGSWTRVSQTDSHLVAFDMLSVSDGWAAGVGGVIAHDTNGAWTTSNQTAPGDVTALQMISPTDGWLAGVAPNWDADAPHAHIFLMHFDGMAWRSVALPALPGGPTYSGELANTFEHFAMLSATEGWAVGSLNGATSLIFHDSGGVWSLDPFAVSMPIDSISMASPTEGWAIGTVHGGGAASIFLHYAKGAWSVYVP
jgi:hypothetical protein